MGSLALSLSFLLLLPWGSLRLCPEAGVWSEEPCSPPLFHNWLGRCTRYRGQHRSARGLPLVKPGHGLDTPSSATKGFCRGQVQRSGEGHSRAGTVTLGLSS